jgi:hypothetical protein
MSYSDEPHVISEKKKSPALYVAIGLLAVFLLTLASIALYPRYFEWKRHNTPNGPNGGTLYFISFEGNRYSMELARSEELDFYMHVFVHPVREATAWSPERFQIRFRLTNLQDEEPEVLDWNAELRAFGPSRLQYHPRGDYQLALEVLREGNVVWEGRRWAYQPGHGHGH